MEGMINEQMLCCNYQTLDEAAIMSVMTIMDKDVDSLLMDLDIEGCLNHNLTSQILAQQHT